MANVRTPISGIVRNSPDSDSDMGSAQELINLRYKDNAWRAIGKKKKLGVDVSTVNKQLGWYHHPSNDDNSFISFDETSRKILLHNIITGLNVVVKKRDGSDFVLPSGEDFNCFTHLENILVLLGTIDRYNFLWINGAFEYIELGNIDWTLSKTPTGNTSLGAFSSKEECIGDYIAQRSTRVALGQIDGICAFRLAIELFDGSFAWFSDIKILRGSPLYVSDNIYNIYEPKIYISGGNHILYNFTDYRPVVTFAVPEWLEYYIEVGVIKALHVCSTKPVYPYIPDVTGWEYVGIIGPDTVWQIKPELRKPHVLFPDETDVFYSMFKIDATNKIPPTPTEVFPFTDIETREVIPLDNFTSNKTSAKHSFIYNQRLHLQQIYNTLGNPIPIDNDWGKNYGVVPYFVQYEVYMFINDNSASGILDGAVPLETTQYTCMVINGLGGYAVNNFKLCSVVYNIDTEEWTYTIIAGELIDGNYAHETGLSSSERYVLRSGSTAIFQDPTTMYSEILPTTEYNVTPTYEMYTDVIVSINNKQYVVRSKCTETYYQVDATTDQVWAGRFFYYPHPSVKEVRFSFSKDGVNFYKVKNPAKQIKMLPNTTIPISRSATEYDRNINFSSLLYTDPIPEDIMSPNLWQYQQFRYMILSVPVSGVDYATHNSCELCTELPASYIDTNRVQLSETSNPLVLPALNSYRFGDINNEINGVELTKDQLSETRFGQFPLYVFSTQGVFALEQGTGSVAYASTNYIDKYIVEDHECIKAIKGYVVFRTKYGIYALAGRTFQEISTQLEGNISVECSSDAKYNALLAMFDNPTSTIISDINPLDTASMICSFDFINDEVWFSPKLLPIVGGIGEQGFSYIFNIVSKKWYKVSEAFSHFVDISPNIIGIKESKSANYVYSFHDMHDENGYNDLKLIVSRTISFNSKYYKRIEHFIARLKVKSVSAKTLYFYLYGSIDGIEYKIIQGGEISTLDLQDQEIRRTFVDFKWLQIVIAFKHETCEVMGFESEIKEKFKTKLR